MKSFICFSILLLTLFACNRKMANETLVKGDSIVVTSAPGQKIPICLAKTIDSIKQGHVWNPPAEIHEYENEGKKVYAISANCCDQFTTVVDANCNYICAPSGGFTGRGDGKCPDFFNKAKHIRLVWKDERARK
ncbi:MAG: hypothetical protein JWQ09_2269 [Segetibacter sp.]|nr:hypothetical protein [Segetibacter sp.]